LNDVHKAQGLESVKSLIDGAVKPDSIPESRLINAEINAEKEKKRAAKEAKNFELMAYPTLDEHIEEFNKTHLITYLGGKCAVIREITDPVTGILDIAFSSPSDFKAYNENKRYVEEDESGKIEIKAAAPAWFRHKKRRDCQGIKFAPGKSVDGYYNLWRGFAVEPKEGDWTLMKKHIFENICKGNQEYFKWLLAWLARIVQDPGGVRSHAAVVLKGEKGVGKGIFVSSFGEIFGNHFVHLTNQNHLTGKFNAHLKSALVVFADESFWAGAKSDEAALKGMITEKYINIEPKGKDVFRVDNYINLLMASNNDWVIPATFDERRFFVLDVSSEHRQDHEYFKAIAEQMKNGGVEAMMYDLLVLDISGINLKNPPRTEALIRQIEESMTPVQKWWYDLLRDGSYFDDVSGIMFPKKVIRDDYLAYCKELEVRSMRFSEVAFGRELNRLCPSIKEGRRSTGKREWAFTFPTLEMARKEFEKVIRFSIAWD